MAARAAEPGVKLFWPSMIGLGLLLILAGFVWQTAGDASQWLDREDAEQYVESAVALHGQTMTLDPKSEQAAEEPAELKLARRQMADSVAKIESAKFKQTWLPRGLQVLGAVLAVAGVVGQKSAGKG